MKVLFLGDGPRDEAVLPPLVARIVDGISKADFRSWKSIRLNRGKGYRRKLRFAIEIARDRGWDGVIAVIDSDRAKPKERLKELLDGRDQQNTDATALALRVALGEAVPHVEAWLIDDPRALKETLGLDPTREIDSVSKCNDPKSTVHLLVEESMREETEIDILAELAGVLETDRCNHKGSTGLEAFLADIRQQFRS